MGSPPCSHELNPVDWMKIIRVQEGKYTHAKESAGDPCDRDGEWDVFTFVAGQSTLWAGILDTVHSGPTFARGVGRLMPDQTA